jgi:hypothetical protein
MSLYYPSAIKSEPHRPKVVFSSWAGGKTQNPQYVCLPAPQGIQFSEGASYDGNAALDTVGALALGGMTADSIKGGVDGALNAIASAIPKNLREAFGTVAALKGEGAMKTAASIASGIIMNKNIVTEFTGIGTRSFSFGFKLISKSKEESDTIKAIIQAFRHGLYPSGNILTLKYPPTWRIRFVQDSNKSIEYLPRIFETYLTSFESNFNQSTYLFHTDGAPIEYDLRMSFIETRALTLEDIQSLETEDFKTGDFRRAFVGKEESAKNMATALLDAVRSGQQNLLAAAPKSGGFLDQYNNKS